MFGSYLAREWLRYYTLPEKGKEKWHLNMGNPLGISIVLNVSLCLISFSPPNRPTDKRRQPLRTRDSSPSSFRSDLAWSLDSILAEASSSRPLKEGSGMGSSSRTKVAHVWKDDFRLLRLYKQMVTANLDLPLGNSGWVTVVVNECYKDGLNMIFSSQNDCI